MVKALQGPDTREPASPAILVSELMQESRFSVTSLT